ncbi:hypothetical protein CDIK_2790 [Cucumispora dikerogammari]|nr:hypothetical protein CDIK_2790 [Cucumispora dikerogammari]
MTKKKRNMTETSMNYKKPRKDAHALHLLSEKKENIIALQQQDQELASIIHIIGLTYNILQEVNRKYNNTQKIFTIRPKRKPGDTLLTDEIILFIKNKIRLECIVTLKTIQTQIHDNFNIKSCL